MRDRLSEIGKVLGGAIDAARDHVPDVRITSDVEVPVYVIHHGSKAEDYELLCDFKKFMAESQSGLLHRPVVKILAGRQDFERHIFARHLREAFSGQFDAVRAIHRAELEAADKRWSLGIPTIGEIVLWGLTSAGGLVGSLLLYLATETSRTAIDRIGAVLRQSMLGRAVAGKSADAALEDLIEEKKSVIDAALARIDVELHPDLYRFAWRGQRPGPMTGINRNAWPLPDFVAKRMKDF
ncbi:MAG: hypothetical protein AAGD13_18865 [Pseudomonadota bacterium]